MFRFKTAVLIILRFTRSNASETISLPVSRFLGASNHQSPNSEEEKEQLRDAAAAVLFDATEAPSEAPAASQQVNFFSPGELSASCQDLTNLAQSPVHLYTHGLHTWLYTAKGSTQWFVSLASLTVGLCLTWDGPRLWQALFTLAVSGAAAGIASFEAQAHELGPVAVIILMCQAGTIMAYALYCSFEGSQVLLGAISGFAGAFGLGEWARGFDSTMPGLALAWYCSGAFLGVLVFTTWRQPVLACLAPMLGGFFFTTGAAVLTCKFGLQAPFLPNPDKAWAEAAAALLGIPGAGALALFGSPVLIAALLNALGESRRPMAIAVLVTTIAMSVLAHGICKGGKGSMQGCPQWLGSDEGWMWPAAGGAVWAVVTAFTAWVQLSSLDEESATDFWRSYPPPLGKGGTKRSLRSEAAR